MAQATPIIITIARQSKTARAVSFALGIVAGLCELSTNTSYLRNRFINAVCPRFVRDRARFADGYDLVVDLPLRMRGAE